MNGKYRAREFAELTGVTVRALHHYDRLALLRPKRSGAGYRLYGVGDLERLEQIAALKFLGLPLKQIRELLDRDTRELPEILRSQRQALEEKRRRLDQVIRAIREAERIVHPGRQPDAAALKKIVEVIEMQDSAEFMNKYYSESAQAKMTERRAQWDPSLQEGVTRAWTELFRDVEAALSEDPAGEKGQALAARWRKLVEGFTGGDAEISAGLKRAWADQANWPQPMQKYAQPFSNPKVWDFIGKAMGCGRKS